MESDRQTDRHNDMYLIWERKRWPWRTPLVFLISAEPTSSLQGHFFLQVSAYIPNRFHPFVFLTNPTQTLKHQPGVALQPTTTFFFAPPRPTSLLNLPRNITVQNRWRSVCLFGYFLPLSNSFFLSPPIFLLSRPRPPPFPSLPSLTTTSNLAAI